MELSGIAAVIAAFGGLASGAGALTIGLRTKQASDQNMKSDVLLELLERQLRDRALAVPPERPAGVDLRRRALPRPGSSFDAHGEEFGWRST